MDLLPIEIFEDCIFPFLELKDIFQFKQVCKYFSTLKMINEEKIKEKIIARRAYLKEIQDKIDFINKNRKISNHYSTLGKRVDTYLNLRREEGINFPEVKGSLNYVKNFCPLPYLSHYYNFYNRFKELVPQLEEVVYFIPLYYVRQIICWYDITLEDIEEEPFYLFNIDTQEITKIKAIDYLQLFEI